MGRCVFQLIEILYLKGLFPFRIGRGELLLLLVVAHFYVKIALYSARAEPGFRQK